MPLDFATNIQNQAKNIGQWDNWTRFHIQVRDATTIYLAKDRKTLEVPGTGGNQQGIAISAASGIVSLDWKGKLFVVGNNPTCLFDIESFDETSPRTCSNCGGLSP